MKEFHHVTIITDLREKIGKSNVLEPTIEKTPNGYKFNWDYQRTSQACQGEWASFSRIIDFCKDYDEEVYKIENEFTEFVKSEFKECFKQK